MVCVPWWHRGGSFLLFSFAVFKATDPCCEICPSWNPSSLFGHLISSIDPLLCLYEVSCNVMLLDFFTTVVLALWLPQPTRLAGSTWLFVYLNKFFLYSTGSPCCKAEVVRGERILMLPETVDQRKTVDFLPGFPKARSYVFTVSLQNQLLLVALIFGIQWTAKWGDSMQNQLLLPVEFSRLAVVFNIH